MMPTMKRREFAPALPIIIAVLLLASQSASALSLPTNDGFVTDAAEIIDADQEARLEQYLKEYGATVGVQTAILTLPSFPPDQSVESVGHEILEKWRIGTSTDGRGILMTYSYGDRLFSMVTTVEMEGDLPKELLNKIIEIDVQPELRDGRYDQAFALGLDSVAKHLTGEYSDGRYDEPKPGHSFGGVLFFFLSLVIISAAAFIGKQTSWWTGLISGIATGLLFAVWYGKWLVLPLFMVLGAIFDTVLTQGKFAASSGRRTHHRRHRRRSFRR